MYKLLYEKRIRKDLSIIPDGQKKFIYAALKIISNNPYERTKSIKKLVNSDKYRIRVGNYRIFYKIIKDTVKIYAILHRKDAYKSLP